MCTSHTAIKWPTNKDILKNKAKAKNVFFDEKESTEKQFAGKESSERGDKLMKFIRKTRGNGKGEKRKSFHLSGREKNKLNDEGERGINGGASRWNSRQLLPRRQLVKQLSGGWSDRHLTVVNRLKEGERLVERLGGSIDKHENCLSAD